MDLEAGELRPEEALGESDVDGRTAVERTCRAEGAESGGDGRVAASEHEAAAW